MNPWQLAGDSESSQQIALFCWCAKAQSKGFEIANKPEAYKNGEHHKLLAYLEKPVPELAFFHHIPNGGSRGDTLKSRMIAGGQLKAEGVKAGVLDCCWPLRRLSVGSSNPYSGLYIELKRPSLYRKDSPQNGCSPEQDVFGQFIASQGYAANVCYTWQQAAAILEWYYNLGAV